MPPIRNIRGGRNTLEGQKARARRKRKPYDKYGTIVRSHIVSPSLTTGPRALYYVMGNTYQKKIHLPQKSNHRSRIQESFILYVDVVAGNADLIQRVKFEFANSVLCCNSPVTTYLEDGTQAMRFQTGIRHVSKGKRRILAKIRLEGRGGTIRHYPRRIVLREGGSKTSSKLFHEPKHLRPWRFVAMPEVTFGIELELSCARGTPSEYVAQYIADKANVNVKHEGDFVNRTARGVYDGWKIVFDGSITCSIHDPQCSKFELVSPILKGGRGLTECRRVLEALSNSGKIRVNKSMGFHVHVNVETLTVPQLIKVCQNFIKYEDVMDTLMPPSRRTGSTESDTYCKSNKLAILGSSNVERHKEIASCKTIEELWKVMNPITKLDKIGRYYKLNLNNLQINRQPTVEFRQHSATSNYTKIAAWVRFCMAFVCNSAKLPRPACLKGKRTTTIDDQFEMMFQYVIQDRALREVYDNRRKEVNAEEDECCTGCAHGGVCASAKKTSFLPPNLLQ